MNKLKVIQKEYQKLSLLLNGIIGKKQIFHHIKNTCLKKDNKTIALIILYVPHNTEEMRHAYKSKYNKEQKNKAILLIIIVGEKQHYLAVKKPSVLLTGVT